MKRKGNRKGKNFHYGQEDKIYKNVLKIDVELE